MIRIRSEYRRGHAVQANYYTDFYPNSKAARGYLARMTNIKQTFNLRSEMPLSLSSVECGRVCFCELATSTAAFLFAECTATMKVQDCATVGRKQQWKSQKLEGFMRSMSQLTKVPVARQAQQQC